MDSELRLRYSESTCARLLPSQGGLQTRFDVVNVEVQLAATRAPGRTQMSGVGMRRPRGPHTTVAFALIRRLAKWL